MAVVIVLFRARAVGLVSEDVLLADGEGLIVVGVVARRARITRWNGESAGKGYPVEEVTGVRLRLHGDGVACLNEEREVRVWISSVVGDVRATEFWLWRFLTCGCLMRPSPLPL